MTMPANPKKISFASASEGTMLRWLLGQEIWEVSVRKRDGEIIARCCVGAAQKPFYAFAASPLAALRKLCRAVKKEQEGTK